MASANLRKRVSARPHRARAGISSAVCDYAVYLYDLDDDKLKTEETRTSYRTYSASAMDPAVQEEGCKLHLQLVLTHLKTGEVERHQISFYKAPSMAVDIKLAVEVSFNIPILVQTLTYETVELKDKDSLKRMRLRSGDVMYITHLGTADVQMVNTFVHYLKALLKRLRNHLASLDGEYMVLADQCTKDVVYHLTQVQV